MSALDTRCLLAIETPTSTDEFHEHSDAEEVLHDYDGDSKTTYRNVMDDDF